MKIPPEWFYPAMDDASLADIAAATTEILRRPHLTRGLSDVEYDFAQDILANPHSPLSGFAVGQYRSLLLRAIRPYVWPMELAFHAGAPTGRLSLYLLTGQRQHRGRARRRLLRVTRPPMPLVIVGNDAWYVHSRGPARAARAWYRRFGFESPFGRRHFSAAPDGVSKLTVRGVPLHRWMLWARTGTPLPRPTREDIAEWLRHDDPEVRRFALQVLAHESRTL